MTVADLKALLNEMPEEANDAEPRNEAGEPITSLEHYEGGYCCSDHLPAVIVKTGTA